MEQINYININKHIAKVFRYYRKKNNYTQEKVAELTGLSTKYVSQLERGISGGTLETILKFCNVYKITPNSLLEPFINPNVYEYTNDIYKKIEQLSPKEQKIIANLIDIILNEQD